MKIVLLGSAALLLGSLPALAQMPGANVATVSAQAAPVARGGHGVLTLAVRVAPGFHINAPKPNDPDLIPTAFQGRAPAGVTFGTPRYPAPTPVTVTYEKQPMLVYTGRAVILVPFTLAKAVKPGRLTLSGTLNFQGCNATSCFPPASAPITAVVIVR